MSSSNSILSQLQSSNFNCMVEYQTVYLGKYILLSPVSKNGEILPILIQAITILHLYIISNSFLVDCSPSNTCRDGSRKL